jgi:hypothetical protein
MPSIDRYFEPEIGDVLLFRGNEIVHASKTSGSTGQLGIALFQKSTFFRGYQVLLDRLSKGVSDEFTSSWFRSEVYYNDL